jgi:type IV secretion system protein VirB10
MPVLPAGTELVGTVTDVKRAGRVKGRAQIAYRFNSLRAAGERYDIKTSPLSHTAESSKGDDAKKIGIGAGAGAALGAVLGGGSGALKGAAIGGAGGTGVVLATRGKEVHVGPGAQVTTKLTAPLTVRVPTT